MTCVAKMRRKKGTKCSKRTDAFGLLTFLTHLLVDTERRSATTFILSLSLFSVNQCVCALLLLLPLEIIMPEQFKYV